MLVGLTQPQCGSCAVQQPWLEVLFEGLRWTGGSSTAATLCGHGWVSLVLSISVLFSPRHSQPQADSPQQGDWELHGEHSHSPPLLLCDSNDFLSAHFDICFLLLGKTAN